MAILYLLIIASLIVAGGFLLAFLWAVKDGQFDDPHSPSVRILIDDSDQETPNQNDQ
ncbi:MAG: cbb3-type cytochrome oxidase assembly protein CcoS [Calditrichaeota bacterium]|nr:cbb3-type cytochrome oxidase assembly protein CcoS [Calditrichota bacterium]